MHKRIRSKPIRLRQPPFTLGVVRCTCTATFAMKRETVDEVTNGARSHTLSRRRSTRRPHFDYHEGRLPSFLSSRKQVRTPALSFVLRWPPTALKDPRNSCPG